MVEAAVKIHILIVDDEMEVLTILSQLIERCGHSVEMANNADEALRIVSKQKFDMIITDIHMLGVNGIELARKIREQFHFEGKIITISGDCVTPEFQHGELFQYVDGRMLKPFNVQKILAAITTSISQSEEQLKRRRYIRHRIFASGQIKINGDTGVALKGKIVNLSEGGAFFHYHQTEYLPPVGSEIILEIEEMNFSSGPILISGACVWVRKRSDEIWPAGIGIRFNQPLEIVPKSRLKKSGLLVT